jgi:hypothetical protein
MRHPLEVYLAHVEVITQETRYSFAAIVQHLGGFILSGIFLAFDQRTDSVNLSSITRLPGPGQINKLGAPATEDSGTLLNGRGAITSLPKTSSSLEEIA